MRIRILGQYVHAPLAGLASIEALAFAGAMVVAMALSSVPLGAMPPIEALWPRALVFAAAMATCLFAFGLYSSRQRALAFGIAVRVVAAILTGGAVTAVVFYLFPSLSLGRAAMGLAVALAALALLFTRSILARLIEDDVFKRRVLVYGCGERAASIASLRRRSDRRGFAVAGYACPEDEPCAVPAQQIFRAAKVLELCAQLGVDEVVVAMDDRRRSFPIRELLECRLSGIDVTDLPTFLERETGRVRIDVLNPAWMIFGEGFRRDPVRLFTSRLLDVVSSLLILILGLPAMLLAALAIKLEDGWRAPLLYRQLRVGCGGSTFEVLKFRSMHIDSEADGQARWAREDDPRITRVGALIRKLRIDELPQVFNVLRGEMSLVGPRPERPEFVAELSERIPYYVERHTVKPGITGWAQLCYRYGSSEQDALEKLQYDLYYIKNHTLLLDLAILMQTVEVVLLGKGAR
ncbi:MAG TPA: TIGR03013 family XrtA/PEP-CTERM system glycosyltransferase [Steroidobacteraceae bacterium]|nr:TIGR03013 family XrtA/PEP-CTERM system glycosyltransferase [Steroidobacteraceae bacterium]